MNRKVFRTRTWGALAQELGGLNFLYPPEPEIVYHHGARYRSVQYYGIHRRNCWAVPLVITNPRATYYVTFSACANFKHSIGQDPRFAARQSDLIRLMLKPYQIRERAIKFNYSFRQATLDLSREVHVAVKIREMIEYLYTNDVLPSLEDVRICREKDAKQRKIPHKTKRAPTLTDTRLDRVEKTITKWTEAMERKAIELDIKIDEINKRLNAIEPLTPFSPIVESPSAPVDIAELISVK